MNTTNITTRFEFEKQFARSVDYYKAYLTLRRLNENINLTQYYNATEPSVGLIQFCNLHKLEITGVEVKRYYHTGGNIANDEVIASWLEKKLGFENDGQIYIYQIHDQRRNIFPVVYAVVTKNAAGGCRMISELQYDRIKLDPEFQVVRIPVAKTNAEGADSIYKVEFRENTIVECSHKEYIIRPEATKSNQWALENWDIYVHRRHNFVTRPVVRITHESLKAAYANDKNIFAQLMEFEIPLDSFMLYCLYETRKNKVPAGKCLNCMDTDIAGGDMGRCLNCNSPMLLFYNEKYPISIDMTDELQNFAALLWK